MLFDALDETRSARRVAARHDQRQQSAFLAFGIRVSGMVGVLNGYGASAKVSANCAASKW